jgi:hypothetical protein
MGGPVGWSSWFDELLLLDFNPLGAALTLISRASRNGVRAITRADLATVPG